MRITYRLTFDDYYDAFRARNARSRHIRQIALALMILLVGMRMRPWTVRDVYALPLTVVVLLSLSGGFSWVEKRLLKRAYKKSITSGADKELAAEISERGIQSLDSTTREEWSHFSKYSETGNSFILCDADSIHMILPKRAFNAADMEQIRQLVSSKLKRF